MKEHAQFNKIAKNYTHGNLHDFRRDVFNLSKKEIIRFLRFLRTNGLDSTLEYIERVANSVNEYSY